MTREPSRRRYGRFFGADPHRDIDDELAFHLAMRVEEMESTGASPDEARAAANERFGNFDQVRTEMETLANRRTSRGRRASILEIVRQDVRFAWRSFRSNPAYAAAVVFTLAIGVAANSLVFSVAYGVLIQPLPYRDAQQIVRLWSRNSGQNLTFFSVSPADYKDWRARATTFTAMGAYERQREATLLSGGDPAAVWTAAATPEVFGVLGASAMIGRGIQPLDALSSGSAVAVISEQIWRTQFGSDSSIIGRRISVDRRSLTVVGVMPRGFFLPGNSADIWTPLDLSTADPRHGNRYLRVLGRLAPGVTAERAHADLNTLAAAIARENPGASKGWDVNLMTVPDNIIGREFRRSLILLGGVVGFVLLISCANVANLQLARGAARRRELGVRTALGASRARIVGQLSIETLVLAVTGGILGVLLAYWGLFALRGSAAGFVPRLDEVNIGAPVLLETFGIVMLATLLAGVMPARRVSRADVADALKSSGSSPAAVRGGDRLRSGLVIAEMALSIVLLVGAGLLMRSFVRLSATALNFSPADIQLVTARAAAVDTGAARAAWYENMVASMRAVPGVTAVSAVSNAPFNGPNNGQTFTIVGRERGPDAEPTGADVRLAMPEYFRVLGITILGGREFTAADRSGAQRVAIINETMARRYWPAQSPIGQQIRVTGADFTIVGIAADARYMELESPELRPMMYFSALEFPPGAMTLTIKTRDAGAVNGGVRRVLAEAMPGQPVPTMMPMERAVASATASRRFALLLFSIFAGVALLLAAIGIYGVMAYMVRQRTHEIGIRLALGASRRSILTSVMARTLRLSAVGLVLGLATAWVLSDLLETLLFGVQRTDVVTYASISATLVFVACVATVFPARRAMRANPVDALRGS